MGYTDSGLIGFMQSGMLGQSADWGLLFGTCLLTPNNFLHNQIYFLHALHFWVLEFQSIKHNNTKYKYMIKKKKMFKPARDCLFWESCREFLEWHPSPPLSLSLAHTHFPDLYSLNVRVSMNGAPAPWLCRSNQSKQKLLSFLSLRDVKSTLASLLNKIQYMVITYWRDYKI